MKKLFELEFYVSGTKDGSGHPLCTINKTSNIQNVDFFFRVKELPDLHIFMQFKKPIEYGAVVRGNEIMIQKCIPLMAHHNKMETDNAAFLIEELCGGENYHIYAEI